MAPALGHGVGSGGEGGHGGKEAVVCETTGRDGGGPGEGETEGGGEERALDLRRLSTDLHGHAEFALVSVHPRQGCAWA